MGYLDGFPVTLRQIGRRKRSRREYSGGQVRPRREDAEARAAARPPRPQPLRGRHGEVHRLRVVRRRVPGGVHLRARRRQPARRPRVPGRALRLRLRDQLPALHPLRPLRGGLPHRGDHRDRSCSSSRSRTARRDLHEGRTARRRRRPAPAPAVGGLARGRRRHTSGWMRATAPSGVAAYEGAVSWAGELGLRRAARPRRDRAPSEPVDR